jgi:hypothetical protein
MTPEQKKTIERCKDMLKRAFPDLTGHVKFDMCSQRQTVKCTTERIVISSSH